MKNKKTRRDSAAGGGRMIKVKTVFSINGCVDCPFKHGHRGHGESWEECRHPDSPKDSWGNIINRHGNDTEAFRPEWCPLGVEE